MVQATQSSRLAGVKLVFMKYAVDERMDIVLAKSFLFELSSGIDKMTPLNLTVLILELFLECQEDNGLHLHSTNVN